MGSRSKRYRKRRRPMVQQLQRQSRRKSTPALPKRFRQHSLLDLIIMPFFLLVGEIVNRIRYALWRWTGGRAK